MPVITSIEDLKRMHKARTPRMFYDYAESGSYTEQTFRENTTDFQKIRLRQQFGRVDLNDDNAIDASEYAKLVLIRNAGTAAPPMARFDTNANGTLEFGEYAALVRALTPKPQPRGAGK